MIRLCFALSSTIAAVSTPLIAPGIAPEEPAATLATVAKGPPHGITGRYAMTVVAAEKTSKATFLNSTANYKGADNVTFSLRPIVAKLFAKEYGAPAETFLIGKHIVVDGVARATPIVNTVSGRPHGLNRIAVSVPIDRLMQIVSVE